MGLAGLRRLFAAAPFVIAPLLVVLVTAISAAPSHGAASSSLPPLPDLVDLFSAGVSSHPWSRDRFVCYRIPSLIRTVGEGGSGSSGNGSGGTLLAVVAERLAPRSPGPWSFCSDESAVNIVLRRSVDGGRTWEAPKLVVASGGGRGGDDGGPSSAWTIQDEASGRVFVFFNTVMTEPGAGAACDCRVSYVTSDDDGRTWSAKTDIPPGGGEGDVGGGKTAPPPFLGSGLTSGITVRASGRMVGCMRRICDNTCPGPYRSKAFYSDDDGTTWTMSADLPDGTTECQIAELSDGRLYMTIRPYKGWNGTKDVRLKSISYDRGTTWERPEPEPSLVDYGFADEGSVASDPDAGHLYFVHPHARDRYNLTLYRSTDDGRTWGGEDGMRTIYGGSSAYSDVAVLNSRRKGGIGTGAEVDVGVLFERDGCGRVSFARIRYDGDGDEQPDVLASAKIS